MPRRKPVFASPGGRGDGELFQRYSPRLVAWFSGYVKSYFRRHFNAVRTLNANPDLSGGEEPLIVVANHPSWWDPLHFLLLASSELPGRRMYGPFDAEALGRYRLFEKLGAFGVDRSPRGAASFLRTSLAVTRRPDAVLWITAEGEFADPRCRPLGLMPGVGHVAKRLERGAVVPVAVEYPFWSERLPEALSLFGTPIDVCSHSPLDADDWTGLIAERLTATMDELASKAMARNPALFRTLLRGRAGVGGAYDLWRRVRARLRGERFDPRHLDERR
jgi:1-acyl-sn-glycerol-3-phosphate acyltransferase